MSVVENLADYPTLANARAMNKNIPRFRQRFFSDADYEAIIKSGQEPVVPFQTLKESIVAVNVYYVSMSRLEITEVEAQQFGEMLASVGGQISLFLGISVLSFLELAEAVYEIIYFAVMRLVYKIKQI